MTLPPSSIPFPDVRPDLRPDLRRAIESMPAARLLGITVRGFAEGGVSVVEMPVRTELTFDGRGVQGGIVGVLADFAGVSAVASMLPEGGIANTTGFEVNNVAPARGERLVAVGRVEHASRSSGLSRVEVHAIGPGGNAVLVCLATTRCRPVPPPVAAGTAGTSAG